MEVGPCVTKARRRLVRGAAEWSGHEWREVGGKCSQSLSRSFGRAVGVHIHQGLSHHKRVQITV